MRPTSVADQMAELLHLLELAERNDYDTPASNFQETAEWNDEAKSASSSPAKETQFANSFASQIELALQRRRSAAG